MTRGVRASGWLGLLVLAGVGLRLAAHGDLAAPPLGSGAALVEWVAGRDPITAAVALVRLLAELAVWYVVVVSALHVVAGALQVRGVHQLADALAAPAVGRLVRAGLGLGLVATTALPVPAPSSRPGATAVTASAPTRGTAPLAPTRGAATMAPAPAERPEPAPVAPAVPPAATWTVTAGDSLWSIAAEVLADAWGRPPSDAEVDPYWRTLVEQNRARLADPGDPDLLHPGQVLEVPPPG